MTKCSIIQDLFTAYISGTASEDTRALVEEHIEACEDCRNKLAEMQNRVAEQLRENDAANINVLKTMKKRIFRRNALVAAIASVVVLAVAFAGYWFVYHHDIPIEYEQGAIRVEKRTAEMTFEIDGIATPKTVNILDLVINRSFYSSYGTSRKIDIDGAETEVVYIYLGETFYSRWQNKYSDEQLIYLAGVGEDLSFSMNYFNYPSLPVEVYYLIMPLDKVTAMSDDDFYAQRVNGVLLWSGTLE